MNFDSDIWKVKARLNPALPLKQKSAPKIYVLFVIVILSALYCYEDILLATS